MAKAELLAEISEDQADPTGGMFRIAHQRGVDTDLVLDDEQRAEILEDIERMKEGVKRRGTGSSESVTPTQE